MAEGFLILSAQLIAIASVLSIAGLYALVTVAYVVTYALSGAITLIRKAIKIYHERPGITQPRHTHIAEV